MRLRTKELLGPLLSWLRRGTARGTARGTPLGKGTATIPGTSVAFATDTGRPKMGTDETVIRDVFAQILASDGGNVVVEGGGAAAGRRWW